MTHRDSRSRGDPAAGPTLAEAIELHVAAMRAKGCTLRSIETVRDESRRHFASWLERQLASLRHEEVAARHESLTRENGPYLADRVMQQLRAVYNTAARSLEGLPDANPVVGIAFNRIRRSRQPVPWGELPAWRQLVEGIRNPVRRDLQLFLLFTGLRSLDARTLRWEHVDLAAGTLHRPRPKGGGDRAFAVPIAREAIDILRRRSLENAALLGGDAGWVFPTRNREGRTTHVQEAKEQRFVAGRKVAHLPSPHRLRDTFAAAASEAGVDPLDLKILTSLDSPATDDPARGPDRPSLEELRAAVESIAELLRSQMDG